MPLCSHLCILEGKKHTIQILVFTSKQQRAKQCYAIIFSRAFWLLYCGCAVFGCAVELLAVNAGRLIKSLAVR